MERSYIGRILKLACLSPRVVEAILWGDEPEGVTVDQVAKSVPLPWGDPAAAEWDDYRSR